MTIGRVLSLRGRSVATDEAIWESMYKKGYIYIITNKGRTTLYTGVTSDLVGRVWQHKNKVVKGFSYKYNLMDLVYFETFDNVVDAIKREKQIKAGSRTSKERLIDNVNPKWSDLYQTVC